MSPDPAHTDVCLILEGSYPYTFGGVSSWTHDLIQMQDHLTFSIVALASPKRDLKQVYELPKNVVSFQTLHLQQLPEGNKALSPGRQASLFETLETALLRLQSQAELKDLRMIIEAITPHDRTLGRHILLDSPDAWNMLLRLYQKTMPQVSFLDYFWSWRGLFGGLFSILLTPLPEATVYHALCTGYAGLLAAQASLKTARPCLLTEHGIYTNERRVEIASADWLDDPHTFNLSVSLSHRERELKDFWIDTFSNYSRFCYEACTQIITLYEGNQEFQLIDGADAKKLRVIPNGVDPDRFGAIVRKPHSPTVALIGRVVPIKDIKTFIKAVQILKQSLPEIQAYVLGPGDEDPKYMSECHELVEHLSLTETLVFTGKIAIEDYLGVIDVIALTSISEAQPLVILEAGAVGIPAVATDVGACREMILGARNENPKLGPGGAIVPVGNPQAMAHALFQLLNEKDYYQRCSQAMMKRVRSSYSKTNQYTAYADLYRQLIDLASSGSEKKMMHEPHGSETAMAITI